MPNKGEKMPEGEERSEIDNSEATKSRSGFAVTTIWILAIATLVVALFLAFALIFLIGGHNHHLGTNDGAGHRSSANQGNMDDGMQPAPDQTLSTPSIG